LAALADDWKAPTNVCSFIDNARHVLMFRRVIILHELAKCAAAGTLLIILRELQEWEL
jgi:hypothetical protein